ncbi:hypothetical protein HY994_05085 [Candidatus Micrarchaeota archaeon]|nr:hypothetical protein [Candidatus Micrarchaeota archaeon]
MGLAEIYQSLEDKYYSFMDAVETKGVRVYEWFINPLEDRGLPSMPFFALGSLLILGVATFAVLSLVSGGIPGFGPGGNVLNVAVKVTGTDGAALDGVIVKLSAGEYASSSRSKNGIANFDSVPYSNKMSVAINADGYKAFSQEFSVSSGKSSTTFSVQLEKSGSTGGTQSVVLFVSDSNEFPLSAAEVRYQDPITGEFVTRMTDAQGKLSLSLSADKALSLSISHDGYESGTISCPVQSTTCQVTLSSINDPRPTPEPSIYPPTGKASVRVELVDLSSGEGLSGKVTLFRNDNGQTLDSGLTDSFGVARFDNLPLGVEVYTVFAPDSNAYAVSTSDPKTTVEATEFFIQLSKGARPTPGASDFSKIYVQALDSKRNPIPGASVRLYVSTGTAHPVSEVQYGDDAGNVSFDVDPSGHFYATVWAQGYLPDRTRVMTGGDIVPILLKPILVGNHGSLNVTVLDDAGVVVSGASVRLITSDGFPVGVPSADTSLDGTVRFDDLPLSSFRAVAVFGAQVGQSDTFSISLEPRSVFVNLLPATAFVSVKGFDAVNKTAIPAGFVATLSSTGKVVGSCNSNGTSCSILVPANRNILIHANSTGFVGLTSEEITVEPGATFSKSFFLLPASLSTQLLILSTAVLDNDGRNVTVLDKGRLYTFALQFNLPSNAQRAGAFVRVGTLSDVAGSSMVLSDYSKPADATIVKGSRFNPGPSCFDDLGDQNGPIQWVDWSYAQFGSKTVSADVFVKPTATVKDQLVIQYRLYAKAGDAFIRNPLDSVLGTVEKTADMDSCYAKTIIIPLTFVDGKSTCNDDACISTMFRTNASSATNGLRVDAGQAFNVSVDLRAFGSLQSPFLTIKSSPSVEFTGYDFGIQTAAQGSAVATGQSLTLPLTFFQRANGTIRMRALIPTQSAKLAFSFGDTSGSILDAPRFVVVQGTGKFQLTPQPLFLEALLDNTLNINVLSATGIPITDAKLTLEETQGSPFDGLPNGPISIQGDGTDGNGKDGKYRFKNLRPQEPGLVSITATREGFEEAKADVSVNATEPLEFGQDIANIQLDCKTPTTLSVRSRVNAELKVTASFSGTGCANLKVLSGSSTSVSTTSAVSGTTGTVSFRVKPNKDTPLILTPALDGNCVLTFNSQTLASQALGAQDAFLGVACFNGVTPTPTSSVSPSASVTPTPVPGADCAATGGQCVAAGQACPNGYVPSTFQPNNGVVSGQQSCQSMGGSCVNAGGVTGNACPTGQTQLNGACANGFVASVCCGSSAVTPTPAPVCANSGQCCQSINKFCQAPMFNFQNIFAKYLGYYMNVQTTSTYSQQVTASSAPTQLTASQSGIGLKNGPGGVKVSSGCDQVSGGLDCKKNIYALLPTNAMAFSVENQLFTESRVLASSSSSTCYAIQETGSQSGLSSIYNGLVNDITSGAALPTRQVRTFVISFKPSPACLDYVAGTDGIFHLVLKDAAKKGTNVVVSAASAMGSQQYKIHFAVNAVTDHPSDRYAFVAMPSGTVTLRGNADASFEEPALFANNIPVKLFGASVSASFKEKSPLVVSADTVIPATLQLNGKDASKALAIQIGTAKASAFTLNVKTVASPKGLDGFDLVGNTVATADASNDPLSCSGANYCTPDAIGTESETGVLFQIKSELNDLAQQYVNNVDTLSYEDPLGINGGDGSAYKRLYQQAMQDALREYAGLQSQYQACVAQGQDPLSGTRAQCAQNGVAPIYGYGQGLPGAYNQQGFTGSYGGAYGNQYGGGLGAPNPAYGGAGSPYNPYASNQYPGAGLYPSYVNNPQVQQGFGNAFGQGWQQAGCNSDILNAFQIQGQLGTGYFNPVQQQLLQQAGYSRGIYSNRKPVIPGLQPVIAVPIKMAGANGGILVYTFKADLSSVSGDGLGDYVQVGYMNSGNYGGLGSSSSTTSSNTLPKGSTTSKKQSGFPYLRLNTAKTVYELQNWQSGNAVYPSHAPTAVSTGQTATTVGGNKVNPAPASTEASSAPAVSGVQPGQPVQTQTVPARADSVPAAAQTQPSISMVLGAFVRV